jgi:hypothetical protein
MAMSLADACRAVLKTTMTSMTPKEVRDGIKRLGYDLSGKSNAMASIHSVLKRLAESGNVHREGSQYLWTGRANLHKSAEFLRDHFAGKALQGYLSAPDQVLARTSPDIVAKWAYANADAMLKAREQA